MMCARWFALFSSLGLLAAVLVMRSAIAHELLPGYLEVEKLGPDEYSVLWKVPLRQGQVVPISPRFPERCRLKGDLYSSKEPSAWVYRTTMLCEGSLAGQRISIDGLPASGTDVLLRYWPRPEESAITVLLKPERASTQLPAAESAGSGIAAYLNLGIQHILTGADHLLFVLALIFIVQGGWMLFKTITAFTFAHSLTLVAASIGVIEFPSTFVEAMIALSIMFLGLEILRRSREQTSFTIQFPWAVAFAFGLLHGLAFASELADFGLPLGELLMAVLLFNAGVEAGQILFIAAVLAVGLILSKFRDTWPAWVKPWPGYAVGIAGAFWFVERTMVLILRSPI